MEKINTGLKNLAKLFKMLKPCEVENKGQTHKEDYSFLSPVPRATCLHLGSFFLVPRVHPPAERERWLCGPE